LHPQVDKKVKQLEDCMARWGDDHLRPGQNTHSDMAVLT